MRDHLCAWRKVESLFGDILEMQYRNVDVLLVISSFPLNDILEMQYRNVDDDSLGTTMEQQPLGLLGCSR